MTEGRKGGGGRWEGGRGGKVGIELNKSHILVDDCVWRLIIGLLSSVSAAHRAEKRQVRVSGQ